jgi:hypothetical protein
MAIAPGFDYDIFVSYAHADDFSAGGMDGWVSQFVTRLQTALRQRLGGAEGLRIFFDSEATGANYQLPKLLTAVTKSALFLAVGSPSYVARDWPRQELETFIRHVPDLSRLFLIECLPLNEGERYPPPLDSNLRLELWKPGGRRHIPVPLSPVSDAEEFLALIHGLAADLRDKLMSLRLLTVPPPKTPTRNADPVQEEGQRKTDNSVRLDSRKMILVAQGTDDVEEEAEQLRRFLKQFEQELIVLPVSSYPQGGEAFKAAFRSDLIQAGLFAQVLGKRPGRMPPDLPEGYTRFQFESAKAAGVEIMQWRHPDLDTTGVTDPNYANMLGAETVVVSGLEAFKRQILDWARKPLLKPLVSRTSTVFINADDQDMDFAKAVERECLKKALTTILPMSGPSSEANRKDLAENLSECDVLVFIYGNTTQDWIRSQLRFFSKIKAKRESEPRLLAICSGPPPKTDIGISFPNAHLINCPDGWKLEPIRSLLSGVG